MTREHKQILVKLAAVMATLSETTEPGGAVPASSVYIGLGMDLEMYNTLVAVGSRMGWLTLTTETVGLTPAGRKQAEKFAVAFLQG